MSNDLTTQKQASELAHPAEHNMPAPAAQRGITPESWHVMKTVLFKGASDEMICTLVDYCKARRLDPLKKPFHIVKVYDAEQRGMVESIWPSIGELRTTAMRTGEYAGKSEISFGPDKTETFGNNNDRVTVTYPEWAQCTIFRMIKGVRVEFAGSPVYWLETYASKSGGAPNAMWKKRPRGQLAKCAEAEALRSAFPEECGSDPTADEMEGQAIGPDRARDVTPNKPSAPAAKNVAPETDTLFVYDQHGAEHAIERDQITAWFDLTIEEAGPEAIDTLAANNRHIEDIEERLAPYRPAAPEPAPDELEEVEPEPAPKPASRKKVRLFWERDNLGVPEDGERNWRDIMEAAIKSAPDADSLNRLWNDNTVRLNQEPEDFYNALLGTMRYRLDALSPEQTELVG